MNGYNFTERVRKVLALAREESARLRHESVGTEHLLLGLIREGSGVAAATLQSLGVDLDALKTVVEENATTGKSSGQYAWDLPYTSRAKKALELSMLEARDLDHSYVGTEHLLLGLSREEKGIAAQALNHAGASLERIRTETLRLLGTEAPDDRSDNPEQSRVGAMLGAARSWVSGNRSPAPERDMGYRFSERIRKVLAMSREEAARLHHEYIGTEHQLLALIREGGGVASQVLQDLQINVDGIRQTIERTVRPGTSTHTADAELPYTSRAKKVLELAMAEARDLNHDYISTEHLLLALIREESGIAAQTLLRAGATLDVVRAATLRVLGV